MSVKSTVRRVPQGKLRSLNLRIMLGRTDLCHQMLAWCPTNNFAKPFDFLQDCVSGGSPDGWPRVSIVLSNKAIDLSYEFIHGFK